MWRRNKKEAARLSMLRKVKGNSKPTNRRENLAVVESVGENKQMMICSYMDCNNLTTDGVSKCEQHRTCSLSGCYIKAEYRSRHCLRHIKESIIPPAHLKEWDVLRIVCSNKECGAITSVGCRPNSKLGIKVCPVCMVSE